MESLKTQIQTMTASAPSSGMPGALLQFERTCVDIDKVYAFNNHMSESASSTLLTYHADSMYSLLVPYLMGKAEMPQSCSSPSFNGRLCLTSASMRQSPYHLALASIGPTLRERGAHNPLLPVSLSEFVEDFSARCQS